VTDWNQGICGTCASPATATAENEGYSYCCNDRIEYGEEAAQTVARANCEHDYKRIAETGRSWNGERWIADRWQADRCTKCGDEVFVDEGVTT
jgi:hypothetical protein